MFLAKSFVSKTGDCYVTSVVGSIQCWLLEVVQNCWCLGHVMESQSEEVVLKEETSIEWLQNESLSVSMGLVLIGLK